MKIFIYKAVYKNASYGQNVTIDIYKMVKNKPFFIGQTFFNTGSCMGVEHEVNKFLIINKYLPKTYVSRKGSYYINYDKFGEDKSYYFYSV